jgi:hypothetical protein
MIYGTNSGKEIETYDSINDIPIDLLVKFFLALDSKVDDVQDVETILDDILDPASN